jgi:hypothetical protein
VASGNAGLIVGLLSVKRAQRCAHNFGEKMKILRTLGWSSALCLSVLTLQAQETNEVEQLRKQLQQMQQGFERVQQEQKRQIEMLMQQIDAMQKKQAAVDTEQERLRNEMDRPIADAVSDVPTAPTAKQWSPTDPIRIGSAQTYLNLSLDGLFAVGASTADDIGELQTGGHDPKQRGFTVQNIETTFEGMVDPYFRGQANIIFQIDTEGETLVEAEEAFLETLALPLNLQVKAGHYLTEFGRLNTVHPHGWDFVDQPLVSGRFLGPDGLRNPGARISWLAPTPFYSELFLGIQNSHGATASSFRSAGHGHEEEESEELPLGFRHPDNDRGVQGIEDMLFAPRYAMSFDVTDTHTVLIGASALFGPNSSGQSGDTDTQIYGLDFTWKWKPASQEKGFPFVTFQTEAMLRKYELGAFDWNEEGDADGDGMADEGSLSDAFGASAVLPGETVTDYGFYSQLTYGFKKGWVAGLRIDYLTGDSGDYEDMGLLIADGSGGGTPLDHDPLRIDRWRISPNLTWYPSEFSKLRLQYNYDDRQGIGVDHSIWLQFEFLLGSHAAHKF